MTSDAGSSGSSGPGGQPLGRPRGPEPVSFAGHLGAVMGTVAPLEPLQVAIGEAQGTLLAEDVMAPGPLPPVGTALLDGYGVRLSDLVGATPATPVTLPVVGDVHAGATSMPLSVQPGFTVRLFAGAPLPPGTEAVVPMAWTDAGLARVAILQAPERGGFTRQPGDDLAQGALVLAAGTHLGPPQIGLLAVAGCTRVLVRPRPRVVVVSTARGLVEVGRAPGPGQTVDANSHALAAACREAGAQAYRVGVLPDDPRRLLDALEDHLIRADVVLASGGGAGAQAGGGGDVVAEVLRRIGDVRWVRPAMQPAGTYAVGTVGPDAVPYLGVPGQPLAALVGFELFVRPALRAMLGLQPVHRPQLTATLTRAVRNQPGVRLHLRVALRAGENGWDATPFGGPGVHPLQGLGEAQGLAVVGEDATELAAGAPVQVILLERRHS